MFVVCYCVLFVDYFEFFDEVGIEVMKVVGMVVVLLFGVYYFICEM